MDDARRLARAQRIDRAFDTPMLVAAVLVIPVVIVEQSSFGEPWDTAAAVANWAIWVAFLVELVVMLAVVPDRRKWLQEHPLEVLIVVLTPPFLASVFAGARALRLVRLLRLLRLAEIAHRTFSLDGLRYVSLLALICALGGGVAFAALQPDQTVANGVYWAMTTMTTVGYGDPDPTTTGSRILAVWLMLVGTGFVAILTGAIAQRFLAAQIHEDVAEIEREVEASEEEILDEIREISERLQRLETSMRNIRRT